MGTQDFDDGMLLIRLVASNPRTKPVRWLISASMLESAIDA